MNEHRPSVSAGVVQETIGDAEHSTPVASAQRAPGESRGRGPVATVELLVRVEGEADTGALAAAVQEVVDRHDVFRSPVARRAEADRPGSSSRPTTPQVQVVDLTTHEEPADDRLRQQLAQNREFRPDREAGPTTAIWVLRLSGECSLVHLVADRPVLDCACHPLLVEEIALRYAGRAPAEIDPDSGVGVAGDQEHAVKVCSSPPESPSALWLPYDRPPPGDTNPKAAPTARLDLRTSAIEKIGSLADELAIDLHLVFLAAFGLLASRYSGEDTIRIWLPTRPATARSRIGRLTRWVPLALDLSGDPSLKEALDRVSAAVDGAAEPDPEESNPPTGVPTTSSPQLVFRFRADPMVKLRAARATFEIVRSRPVRPVGELELEIREDESGMVAAIFGDPSLFDQGTITRIAEHLRGLLEQAIELPDRAGSSLPILTPAETALLLDEWRGEDVDPPGRCIHDRFREWALKTPDAVAISYRGERITYAELDATTHRLAHALAGIGVRPGDRVAILAETGPAHVALMLAVLEAGASFVSLDVSHPTDRLRAVLEEAEPSLLVAESSCTSIHSDLLTGSGPEQQATALLAGSSEADAPAWPPDRLGGRSLAEFPASPTTVETTPEAPAYVAYTSGSTGKPKGIQQSHGAFVQFLDWQARELRFGPGERVAHWASVAYDASYCEIFGAICFGATLCQADPATRFNPRTLVDWVRDEGITVLQMVPSFCRETLEVAGEQAEEFFGGLRLLMLAGERLPVDLARQWLASFPEPPGLVNLYGPSECVLATYHHVDRVGDGQRSISIGRPIAGRDILVLDDRQQPVPLGVRGEIYVRSRYLSMGYLGRPEQTEARFLPDLLHQEANTRVFRTGDIGRWRADGTLEFFGRDDNLVKLRGVRVELGDVENAVRSHPDVRDAAALVREVTNSGGALIAKVATARTLTEGTTRQLLVVYYTARNAIDKRSLREHIEQLLPPHMVPQQLVELEELPLNANRKLDRSRLPDPQLLRPDTGTSYVAPRDEIEEKIAAIWAEVLGFEEVGVEDNFFDLGGDSLTAMQVLNSVREVTGVSISFADLFGQVTLGELARKVRSVETAEVLVRSDDSEAPLNREDSSEAGHHPLSLSQEGIWFLWNLDPDNPYYTAQGSIRLLGRLDLPAFRRAWKALLERHQILRARFDREDGNPVQTFFREESDDIRLVDLSHLPEGQRRERMNDLTRREVRPLDLERDDLFAGRLFRLGPEEHEVAITFHEIVLDLWGLSVMIEDLRDLYDAFVQGEAAPGGAPPRFSDYVRWERTHLSRESLAGQKRYWEEQLSGELPVLDLPLDRQRPVAPTYRGDAVSTFLDVSLSERVRDLGRRHGATLFMTLLAGFFALLRAYSQQEDIIVGAPIAKRDRHDAARLVGFFLNMLPLRADVSVEQTFAELLGQVRETVSRGLSNSDFPFSWMLESTRVERDLSVSPVFQVMFNMLNLPQRAARAEGLELTFSEIDTGYSKYDLALYAQEHGDQIFLQLAYLTDLFDPATARRMLDNLVTLLEDAVEEPDRALGSLDAISPAERRFLVVEANATAHDFGDERTLQELFEAQVERTPDDTALMFEGETLDYARLNDRANRLARHLRELGVTTETPVALCLNRGFDTIVAMLAVIKAGGAYVALEPEYPLPRLREMIEDSRPSVMVLHAALDRFDGFEGPKVVLDGFDGARYAAENLSCGSSPGDLLNIVYTSSSTGKPKGVLIEQSAVLNRLHWMWNEYPFQGGDVAVMHKSYALVAATWEAFGALLQGVPTLLLGSEALRDPGRLWSECTEQGVSHLLGVPVLLEGVLYEAERDLDGWSSLRLSTTSAEPIAPTLAERWNRRFPEAPLLNLYGATECASNALGYDTSRLDHDAVRVPVGRPLPNVAAYVLDDELRLVPMGATGELCISGGCLARGYLNLPELNADRFVSHPYRSGDVLYRTGDLARYRSDGQIELVGRADLQVKIRGFRVELNDVETTLDRHEQVHRSVVILDEREGEPSRLVAFIQGDDPSPAALREFVSERLPSYMVPAVFVLLEDLPKTPNGKVDRKALEATPVQSTAGIQAAAARDEVEARLQRIWSDVLGVANVGVEDDFFELGGHSLLAIRLMDRIAREFKQSLPIATLFRTPTISSLARLLRSDQRGRSSVEEGDAWSSIVPIQKGARELPFFCVHDGAGGVFHFNYLAHALGPDQPFYGLQPHGWDSTRTDAPTIEGLAAHYVEEIRSIQSDGPYLIGGFCFGGIVALEIAQQLTDAGERVALLGLIEPSRVRNPLAPQHPELGLHLDRGNGQNGGFGRWLPEWVWKRLVHKQGAELVDPEKVGTLRSPLELVRLTLIKSWVFARRGLCRACLAMGRPIPRWVRNFYFKDQVSRKAGVRYAARPYPGVITLFLARRHGLDWHGLASEGLTVHRIPAGDDGDVPDHLQMLRDPHIRHVARPLRAAIDRIVEERR